MRNGALMVVLAATAALLSACGGGDPEGSAAQEQVRAAAQRIGDTHDGAVVCDRLVTARFLDEVFEGDRAACAGSGFGRTTAPSEGRPTIAGVEVSGPKAYVETRQSGGPLDGVGGHLRFVREGTAWKLDGYKDDYLRGAMVAALVLGDQRGQSRALAYAPLRDCMVAQAKTVSMATVRTFTLAVMRNDPRTPKLFDKHAERCPDELAAYVAREIADALSKGAKASEAYIECVKARIRGLLNVTELSSAAMEGNTTRAGPSALEGLARGVATVCKGK
jgi:hypothetical protein